MCPGYLPHLYEAAAAVVSRASRKEQRLDLVAGADRLAGHCTVSMLAPIPSAVSPPSFMVPIFPLGGKLRDSLSNPTPRAGSIVTREVCVPPPKHHTIKPR